VWSLRQWGVVGVASLTRFASGILMGTALAVFVGRRGSPLAVSLVLTSYFAGLMLFAPVWGAIADETGRRRTVLLVTGTLATAAVLPLTVLDGVVAPILARGLYAVFAAGFAPVMLAIVSDHGGDEGRGRSLGVFNSTRAVGFAGGQLTVGALLGLLAPAELYLVIAGVSLVSTVLVAFVADPADSGRASKADGLPATGALLGAVRDRLLPGVEDRAHLRSHGLGWLYVALALRNMTVLGVMSLMPPYLVSQVVPPELVGDGLSELLMGALLAINPATQVGFMIAFGYLADTAGRKPPIVAGMAGSGGFALVAAAATLPAGLLARAGLAALALVVLAASYSLMTVGALALIGDVAPADRESELMGLRSTAKGVGGVLGPPLLGTIATLAGYRAAFAAGSVLALVAAGLAATRLVESHTPAAPAATADD